MSFSLLLAHSTATLPYLRTCLKETVLILDLRAGPGDRRQWRELSIVRPRVAEVCLVCVALELVPKSLLKLLVRVACSRLRREQPCDRSCKCRGSPDASAASSRCRSFSRSSPRDWRPAAIPAPSRRPTCSAASSSTRYAAWSGLSGIPVGQLVMPAAAERSIRALDVRCRTCLVLGESESSSKNREYIARTKIWVPQAIDERESKYRR